MSDPMNELEYGQGVGEVVAPAARAPALGQHAMHGFVWLMSQALGAKVLTMAGQIVLSWLLGKKVFGLVGLSLTIPLFVSILHQGGFREMLIQRGKDLAKWQNAAIWYSLALGLVSAGLIAVAARPAAIFYHNDGLTPLILILAVESFFMSLTTVPEARVQTQLRFKFMAGLNMLSTVLTMVLSICLAVLIVKLPRFPVAEYGAYAFILPRPVVALARLVVGWTAARPRVRWDPEWHLWAGLTTGNTILAVATVFYTLTISADRVVLGHWHSDDAAGLYWWAFGLSMQTMQLIQGSVATILFPSLATLKDEPARQTKAFVRASQALMLVGVPACFLQAALANSGVHLIFKSEWYTAITTLEVLSVAMALLMSSFAALNIIKAQGRFMFYLVLMIGYAVFFLVAVGAGAYLATPQGAGLLGSVVPWLRAEGPIAESTPGLYVAWGLLAFTWISAPVIVHLAIGKFNGTWRDVARIHIGPVVASGGAMGGGWWLGNQIGAGIEGKWMYAVRAVVITVVGTVLYVPLIRWMAREAYEEVKGKVMGMVRRGRKGA